MSDDVKNVGDKKIIPLNREHAAILFDMQREIYPANFVESFEYLKKVLSDDNINIGVTVDGKLAGFLLAINENDGLFLYDMAVLPAYQKKGLGTFLLEHFLGMAYKKHLKIYVCCREQSYPMFSKAEKILKMGYKITGYKFEKDGYFENSGVHEDSYEMYLEPVD